MKEIVFDFDGTLVKSLDCLVEVINGLSEKYEFPKINAENVEYFRNNGLRATIKHYRLPLWRIALVNKEAMEKYLECVRSLELVDGIKELIINLKKKDYKVGILTSNSRENIEEFLKRNQFELIDYVYSGGSVLGKHVVLKRFLKSRNLKAEDLIYVGDEVRDIEACKKVGIKIMAVTWGFNSKEALEKYNPDWLVSDPGEIVKKINS